MPVNSRPVKSLNPRPTSNAEQGSQAQTFDAKYSQSGSATVQPGKTPVTPLVKGAPVQNTSNDPAFMGQRPVKRSNATAVAQAGIDNPLLLFVAQMKDLVGSFAILSDDVINQNIKMALGGFSAEDRTMPYEVADYLMSNMGCIFMGLVLDENFKNNFKASLKLELEIDSQSPAEQAAIRKKMKDAREYKSRGSMVIGTSDFVPEMKVALAKKLQNSFTVLDDFADEFDNEISRLTREQKLEYGFIFSNFMYLARAFTHNDLFMSYVISVIEKVKVMTGAK